MPDPAVCVEIVHNEVKIGDSLCTLPLIMQLARISGADVHVTGAFADSVKALTGRLPIRFDVPEGEPITVRADVARAYAEGQVRNLHMAASFCRLGCVPVPALPFALDLTTAPAGLPPGIVLSPFSGSRNPWYKAWPLPLWRALVRFLAENQGNPVYVLGADHEDAAVFVDAGAIPLSGLALPMVLQLIRDAALFVSIDNGLSHLAHFGTVKRHVLLYPALLPPFLVVNPWARVLRGRPQDISVSQVIAQAEAVLRDGTLAEEVTAGAVG
jgi:hypothetical protein